MASAGLLRPTLHVEIRLASKDPRYNSSQDICHEVAEHINERYAQVQVGQDVIGYESSRTGPVIEQIVIADYTGPPQATSFHKVEDVQLDIQTYTLKSDKEPTSRRRITQEDEEEGPQIRTLALPNVALKDEWDSLIYDNALPSQLLRYLTRMLGVMKQPGLNLSTFNWNRLCLLHGPPGSGKSTLCRALAQKLSIRLNKAFPQAKFVEVNTNSMLSKYFGESGKLISSMFDKIHSMAQSSTTLVCVVMDEVETIAGSREKVSSGGECNDGLRATNQLLTALDRLRSFPNIIVLCTSNLLDAIDPAFLDRVDIKQLIPSPSPAAIYNIYRSCLNELVRASLIDVAAMDVSSRSSVVASSSPCDAPKRRAMTRSSSQEQKQAPTPQPPPPYSSSPDEWEHLSVPMIPTYHSMKVQFKNQPNSPARRVWALAQKCQGFSGRTLRRLPILGLAMYTWGGNCSMQDAVSALEAAVDQEMKAKQKNVKAAEDVEEDGEE